MNIHTRIIFILALLNIILSPVLQGGESAMTYDVDTWRHCGKRKVTLSNHPEKAEGAPFVQQWKRPAVPDDLPEVERIVALTNRIIEKYNGKQLQTLYIEFKEEWNSLEDKGAVYDSPKTPYLAVASKVEEDGTRTPSAIDVVFLPFPTVETEPVPFFKLIIHDETVEAVFAFYPPINEDFYFLLRQTNQGTQLITLSCERHPSKETPWLVWGKTEKSSNERTRIFAFGITSFSRLRHLPSSC